MKKKNLMALSLLTLSAVVIGACQPLAPVESISAVAETNDSEISLQVGDISDAEMVSAGYGNGYGGEQDCEDCQNYDGAYGQHGKGGGNHGEAMGNQVPAFSVGEISQEEIDGLVFMREEEKLARDVYLTLYEEWGLRPFSNIAASEEKHTDAIKALLEIYEITDPVTDDTVGVFANADLQALNDQLLEMGSASLVDALKVGAAIEEIDILDLIKYLEATEEANIEWVYENLLAGSENHLRAFVSQLEAQTGESYLPQYLSQEAYDAIMSASSGHGNGQQGNSQGNGRGNGQGSGRGNK